jgi:putative tryptophan/tyrosine transport system substrate-binding protein
MRRRDFIAGLGAAAWPVVARAQQPAMPVIGYLSSRTADSDALVVLPSVRRGLADVGYAEGRNVAIQYHFTDGRYDRLSAQLIDFTQRKVSVIVLAGLVSNEELVQQVRASPIPIVFITGADPVHFGLVASMNRPGGNVTGVNTLVSELSGKQLGLLRDLVPRAVTIAALVDPIQRSGGTVALALRDTREAAAVLGQKLRVLEAGTVEEIDVQSI